MHETQHKRSQPFYVTGLIGFRGIYYLTGGMALRTDVKPGIQTLLMPSHVHVYSLKNSGLCEGVTRRV